MKIVQPLVDTLSYLVGRVRGEWDWLKRWHAADQAKVQKYFLHRAEVMGIDTDRPFRLVRMDVEGVKGKDR